MRERGLKVVQKVHLQIFLESLPVRERGLKVRLNYPEIFAKLGRSLCGSVG